MAELPVGLLLGVALLSLAFFISFCLNVILCIRRRAHFCTDIEECCFAHSYTGERPSQDEGNYLHNLNNDDQLHDHRELQENPIYGNISSDRRDSLEVCYEMMAHTRHPMTSLEPDLNYASLDLKKAKTCMKSRLQHGHAQGPNRLQDELPVRLTPPLSTFLEVEADMDARLLSRDTMVSHSSIYLNSQQIAQEAEEMERERAVHVGERENVAREGIRRWEHGRSREWKEEQDSGERDDMHDSNGSVCTQLSAVEAIQSGTDHFVS